MAAQDRRNPYVILGIPFGSTGPEARAGFARSSRRLRQEPTAAYSQEDLTWALHQVEQILTNPQLAFEVYRIPASASALTEDGIGVFHPAPHRLERTTEPDPREWVEIRRLALANALRRVLAESIPKTSDYIPYE